MKMKRKATYNDNLLPGEVDVSDLDGTEPQVQDPFSLLGQPDVTDDEPQAPQQPQAPQLPEEVRNYLAAGGSSIEDFYKFKYTQPVAQPVTPQKTAAQVQAEQIQADLTKAQGEYTRLLSQGATQEEMQSTMQHMMNLQLQAVELTSVERTAQIVADMQARAALPTLFTGEMRATIQRDFGVDLNIADGMALLDEPVRQSQEVTDLLAKHPAWRQIMVESAAYRAIKAQKSSGKKPAPQAAFQTVGTVPQRQQAPAAEIPITIDMMFGRKAK